MPSGKRRASAEQPTLPRTYTSFRDRFPGIVDAHEQAAQVAYSAGPLDRKMCELIKIGIALGAGLESAVRLRATLRRWLSLFLEYHRFDLDEATDAWYTTGLKAFRRDPSGHAGKSLGNELDVRVTATPWKHVELMAGAGRFFPGAFVKRTGPAAPANWYFAQTSYTW